MPRVGIQSAEDVRIRAYRELPRRKASRRQPHFVVEGRWLVRRLIRSDLEVASVLCREHQADEFAGVGENVPIYVASSEVISEIVGFEFHRGVLACGHRPHRRGFENAVQQMQKSSLLATCAGVCDQENLGSVIRNCQALGVGALLLDSRCADPYSRRVMRVSAGAALNLPIVECDDLWRDLKKLRSDSGFHLVAAVLDCETATLEESSIHPRMVVLFGNEGFGLDDQATTICDQRVTLPMQGGVDSLNIGVASGIFLHHYASRQRSLDI